MRARSLNCRAVSPCHSRPSLITHYQSRGYDCYSMKDCQPSDSKRLLNWTYCKREQLIRMTSSTSWLFVQRHYRNASCSPCRTWRSDTLCLGEPRVFTRRVSHRPTCSLIRIMNAPEAIPDFRPMQRLGDAPLHSVLCTLHHSLYIGVRQPSMARGTSSNDHLVHGNSNLYAFYLTFDRSFHPPSTAIDTN